MIRTFINVEYQPYMTVTETSKNVSPGSAVLFRPLVKHGLTDSIGIVVAHSASVQCKFLWEIAGIQKCLELPAACIAYSDSFLKVSSKYLGSPGVPSSSLLLTSPLGIRNLNSQLN